MNGDIMTAQILSSELSNLIQESKRKHPDIRSAAEKSLDELKSLRSTSDAQLATDLSQRSSFVTPFLIACGTKNTKFTGIAIVCLQRLVVSRALSRTRLNEVLDAFREATSAGLDVQLKILQALPSLLQNYADNLKGDLLAGALNICSVLQTSKNGIVNNTAAATLQQLVVTVFDKVVTEDKVALEAPTIAEIPLEKGTIHLRAAAFDAYRVFNDICLLTESQKPQFLKFAGLPQTFGLELIESVITNHADIFLTHVEQANILRIRVMPFIISSLSEKLSFATSVRTVRILYTLLRRHLSILIQEGEMVIGLLIHMLDLEAPHWKRALCMEVFRGLFSEASLIRQIFSLYDTQKNAKNVLGDLVASFVRLSTEKPHVIGLGQQSSMPSGSSYTGNGGTDDQAVLEASGISGIISSPMPSGEPSNIGISIQWSSMRVPCIDQLDKADPPSIPESYVYSLALTCVNNFTEGLAKFILPLTVPSDIRNRKRAARPPETEKEITTFSTTEKVLVSSPTDSRKITERGQPFKKNPIPLNPLALEDHPLNEEIKVCAAIVDSCWPAILATCSTFLYAALDAEYYHNLVRSFQKFAHVAGLLRLSTPRDAFLTTLGKAAVPSNVLTAPAASNTVQAAANTENHGLFSNARGLLSVDALGIHTSNMNEKNRQSSIDSTPQSLNTRNLLCLRALLNLGIALGPTLESAWFIILETLQQADFVLYISSRGSGRPSSSSGTKVESQIQGESWGLLANFGPEIKAVETAASRLFESTVDFPNESFVAVLTALCNLITKDNVPIEDADSVPTITSPTTTPRKPSVVHRRINSISIGLPAQNQEDFFALAKLGDVASINIDRLMAFEPDISGWTILTTELISVATTLTMASPIRLRAAEILVRLILEAATATMSLPDNIRMAVQWQLLHTLRQSLKPLEADGRETSVAASTIDIDIHKIILEGFKNILEHCGETLISGWDIAFEIIGSVFKGELTAIGHKVEPAPTLTRSAKLVRSSFSSLQLICSDFLSSIPSSCFLILVNTLYNFCTQDDDLNICLTTVTFFWVLADFLSSKTDSFTLGPDLSGCENESALIEKASSDDASTSNAGLWMLLLLRLTAITTDERLELRNSAIQTLLRIFDAYGDHLSPEAWSLCIRSIIFKMLSSIEAQLEVFADSQSTTSSKEKVAWIETTVLVLNGISGLLTTYLSTLTSHSSFTSCWRILIDHFKLLLKYTILDVNTAIFRSLRQLLSHANIGSGIGAHLHRESIDLVWQLWSQGLPLASVELTGISNNQDCLIAYVALLKELYRLMGADVDAECSQRILTLLRDAVQEANITAYSADIEYLTPLQTQVLESLKIIRTGVSGVPAAMIVQVAEFSALAFQKEQIQPDKQRQTYIALSKESMTFLGSLILTHTLDPEIYTSGALTSSLVALSKPIEIKYTFPVTAKSLPPWKHATTTALTILKATLPVITGPNTLGDDVKSIWSCIVKIASGIISATYPLALIGIPVREDEDFDITSFLTLRDLITPALGAHTVPDKIRHVYTESLFYTSLIHAPEPGELPQSDKGLLKLLYEPRKGRTIDPPPCRRARMSYVCFDELVSLVSVHDSSPSRVRLAQAAAPYLILRAGITLRAYIADQPLRGDMPQPLSQRKELLYVLKALVELKCEPNSIPNASNDDSKGKKHLHRLYPLLAKAVMAAAGDQEVLGWLGKALEEVGMEFKV